MVKHNIALSLLCFIVYIVCIGGIREEVTNIEKFERAVECHKQMFEAGILKGLKSIQPNENDSFETVLDNFYIKYGKTDNVTTAKDIFYQQLETVGLSQELIKKFYRNFYQVDNTNTFNQKINDLKKGLTEKITEPLKTFINKYDHDSTKVCYRNIPDFCNAYSRGENFDKV